MNVLRWTCWFNLKDKKRNILSSENYRDWNHSARQFGGADYGGLDMLYIKTMHTGSSDVHGWRLTKLDRGHPKACWWYCVREDKESFGLSREHAQDRHQWRKKSGVTMANMGLRGKWPFVRRVCVYHIIDMAVLTSRAVDVRDDMWCLRVLPRSWISATMHCYRCTERRSKKLKN